MAESYSNLEDPSFTFTFAFTCTRLLFAKTSIHFGIDLMDSMCWRQCILIVINVKIHGTLHIHSIHPAMLRAPTPYNLFTISIDPFLSSAGCLCQFLEINIHDNYFDAQQSTRFIYGNASSWLKNLGPKNFVSFAVLLARITRIWWLNHI